MVISNTILFFCGWFLLPGRSFIVATTDVINGNTFLSSLFDDLKPAFVNADAFTGPASTNSRDRDRASTTQSAQSGASTSSSARAGGRR